MHDNKVAQMRSFKGAGCGPVALAARFESEAKFILDLGRGARGKRCFELPFERVLYACAR